MIEMFPLPPNPPRQLNMLQLILAHWHQLRFVQKDVGSLQHGVIKQPNVDVLRLRCRLVFELGHALKVAKARDVVEHPAKFGMFWHH